MTGARQLPGLAWSRPGAPGPSGRVSGAALWAPPVRSPRPAGRGFCGVLGPVGPSGGRFGPLRRPAPSPVGLRPPRRAPSASPGGRGGGCWPARPRRRAAVRSLGVAPWLGLSPPGLARRPAPRAPPRPGPWPVLRAGPRRARSLALGVGLGLLRGPWRAPCAALRPPPLRAPSLAGPPALRPLRGPAGPLRGSASGLPGSSRRAGLAALRAACSAPPRPAAGVGLTRAAASAPPGTAPPPACTSRSAPC